MRRFFTTSASGLVLSRLAACLIFLAVILVTPRLAAAQENAKIVRFEWNAEHSSKLQMMPDSARKINHSLMVGGYFATIGRERESKVLEGAVIGLTVGALAGGVITILGNESGNLGLNLIVLALPGAVIGALVGAVW